MTRRPDGALEHEVLSVLWASEADLSPGEVQRALSGQLAYTSVATVLGRLYDKGLVTRTASGRAFVYRAVVSESDLAARRMGDLLAATSDRNEVLARFVGELSAREARQLRRLLDPDRDGA